MTTQYKIVPINPNLHKTIIDHWEKDKLNLKDESNFRYVPDDGYHHFWKLNNNHPLYDLINFPIPYYELIYMRNNPKVGMGPVHIDANRKQAAQYIRSCALNIPIQVNLKSSLIFTAKKDCECTKLPKYDNLYYYEPEKYDFYNLRQPALINTQNPHGGANFADTHRVLLSVSFLESYDFVSTHI